MKLENIIAKRPRKTLYREGDLTVKVFDESFTASDVLNEALNLAIVGGTGFAVPRLEEVTKINGCWAIVSEHIEGQSLHTLMQQNPERSGEYMERLVDIQLQMHDYKAPRLWTVLEKMHGKISATAAHGLAATTRYELHTRLDSLPRHKKLCHGDFTPGNIIITPDDRAYVIDWAHATQGNASADAARTYLRFTLAGMPKEAELYMHLFCKKSDTARQYVNKWMPIIAASQLTKGVAEERELLLRWADVVEYE